TARPLGLSRMAPPCRGVAPLRPPDDPPHLLQHRRPHPPRQPPRQHQGTQRAPHLAGRQLRVFPPATAHTPAHRTGASTPPNADGGSAPYKSAPRSDRSPTPSSRPQSSAPHASACRPPATVSS